MSPFNFLPVFVRLVLPVLVLSLGVFQIVEFSFGRILELKFGQRYRRVIVRSSDDRPRRDSRGYGVVIAVASGTASLCRGRYSDVVGDRGSLTGRVIRRCDDGGLIRGVRCRDASRGVTEYRG